MASSGFEVGQASPSKCNFQWHAAISGDGPTQGVVYLILGAPDKVLPVSGDGRQGPGSWLEHGPFSSSTLVRSVPLWGLGDQREGYISKMVRRLSCRHAICLDYGGLRIPCWAQRPIDVLSYKASK